MNPTYITSSSQECLRKLENLWKTDSYNITFRNKVIESFETSHNPYELLLNLSMHSFDSLKYKKNNFSHTVINIFEYWIAQQHVPCDHLLNDVLKENALIMSTRRHTAFFLPMAFIFKIKTLCLSKQIAYVSDLIDNKIFHKAALVVSVLDLYKSFNIYTDILLPLMLLDDMNYIKILLKKKPEEQRNFVIMLDTYLNNIPCLRAFAVSLKFPPIKEEKVNVSSVKKILTNLLKYYGLDLGQ